MTFSGTQINVIWLCSPGPSGCLSETGPCFAGIQVLEERAVWREAWGCWEAWRSRVHRCHIYHRRGLPAGHTLPRATTPTAAELGWSPDWTAQLWIDTPSHLPDGGGCMPRQLFAPLALRSHHSGKSVKTRQDKRCTAQTSAWISTCTTGHRPFPTAVAWNSLKKQVSTFQTIFQFKAKLKCLHNLLYNDKCNLKL